MFLYYNASPINIQQFNTYFCEGYVYSDVEDHLGLV